MHATSVCQLYCTKYNSPALPIWPLTHPVNTEYYPSSIWYLMNLPLIIPTTTLSKIASINFTDSSHQICILKCTWSNLVKLGQSLYREKPGQDKFRPKQATSIVNFFSAGSRELHVSILFVFDGGGHGEWFDGGR